MDLTRSGAVSEGPSLPGEAVDRLLYASQCCVIGPIFEEMHRIREHALKRNAQDHVHVALLYQAGWFMEWLEGPTSGVRAAMQRVQADPRHKDLRIVHNSVGHRRLTQPWSMAYRHAHDESSEQFGRRVEMLAGQVGRGQLEPAAVWRRLSMPLKAANAQAARAEDDHYQRVMLLSAQGTKSFDLVHWLAAAQKSELVSQRIAGVQSRIRDVAVDHVDVQGRDDAMPRRVVAMARNGLQIGLVQAFLPDYSHLALILSGDARHDMELLRMLVNACWRMSHRPVLVGMAIAGFNHLRLREAARLGRMAYLDCDLFATAAMPEQLWAALEPALDFSRSPRSA